MSTPENDHPKPEYYIDYEFEGKAKKLYGGSFFHAPGSKDFLTINLMQERPGLGSDLYLPIQDYSCPTDEDAMIQIFDQIKNSDKDAYVGCWGGVGRTGLFMSCFLKHLGYENTLLMVREQYNGHAVETEDQADYLYNFPSNKPAVVSAPKPHTPK